MSVISNQASNSNANVNFESLDNSQQAQSTSNNLPIKQATPEIESPITQSRPGLSSDMQGAMVRSYNDGMPAQMMKSSLGDKLKASPEVGDIVTKGPNQPPRYDRPEYDRQGYDQPRYDQPDSDPYSNRPSGDPSQYGGNKPVTNYGPSNDGGVQRPKNDLEKAQKRLDSAERKLQKAEQLIERYKQNCQCPPKQNPGMEGPGAPQYDGGNKDIADQIKQIQDGINKIGQQLSEISKKLQMQKDCAPMQSPGMNTGGVNDTMGQPDSILSSISNLLSEFIKKLQELLQGSDKGAGQGDATAQGAGGGGAPANAGKMTGAMPGAGKTSETGNAQPASSNGKIDGTQELLQQVEQLLQQILAKLTELLKQVQNGMGATNPQMMAKQMLA